MALKTRIEYEGARYHVINRGNDRSWIFESAGARKSFLVCLEEACVTKGWRLHAWCHGGLSLRLAGYSVFFTTKLTKGTKAQALLEFFCSCFWCLSWSTIQFSFLLYRTRS